MLSGANVFQPLMLWLLLTWTMVIPAQVVLTRVQASLLPGGKKTIVPFDRTFGMEKARERGYLTLMEAWASISGYEWVHIYTTLFCAYRSALHGALGFLLYCAFQCVLYVWPYADLGLIWCWK